MHVYEILDEGVNDPAIFKVVFIIGGPGSGKSYVARNLALQALGYVNINSDVAFEYLMKKRDLDPKMPAQQQPERDAARQRAKEITVNRSDLALEGRLGIVIDGTGHNYEKIAKLKQGFDLMGYNNFLVVVNTELDVARQRNQRRHRTVPDDIVVASWNSVQQNIGKFAQIFENVSIIDNSGDAAGTKEQIQNTYRKIVKFTDQPPNKPAARRWIADHQRQAVAEKWSQKYKKSINCANPRGFSQRAHCAGRKKNEDVNEVSSIDRPDEQTKVMSLNDLQKHIGLPKMKLIGRHPEYMKNFYSAQSVGIPVGGRFSRHNGFETVDIAHGPMGDRNFRRMLTFHFSLGGKKISSVDVYQNWDNEKHSNGSILWRHVKTIEHPVDRRANARMAKDMEKNMPRPETDV